jgi:uncharacterized damage-inducible protein DinB
MKARELLIDTFIHIPPRTALEDLTAEHATDRRGGSIHSIAEIVAHMSFWQRWFCDRCEGKAAPMVSAAADGWPAPGPWTEVRESFLAGLERAAALATQPDAAITPAIAFAPLAHYTVRDAIVHMAQHNSHHLGQVFLIRQLLGVWPPPSGGWTW